MTNNDTRIADTIDEIIIIFFHTDFGFIKYAFKFMVQRYNNLFR